MEPITRQEQLLDSIATGSSVELEPITREEMYLSAIAGSTDFIPEKPITRKEMFYEKILESGGVGGDGTAKPTQTKTIKVVENGTYKVTPDSGKVLSSVTANVNVPERYEEGFAEGKEEGYNEGYNKGLADNEPVLEALTATENKEYTPSDNVDGFSSVTVNVPLKYDEGFQAGVDSVKLQEKTVTENGDVLPDDGFSGMKKVTVAVPVSSGKEEQEKSITITQNGTTEVTPDEGKTLSKVTIETLVSGGGGSGEVDEVVKAAIEGDATEIILPNSISKIGTYKFYRDTNLVNIQAAGVTSIGDCAFESCTNLAITELPAGLTSVGLRCFFRCSNLALTKLPVGLTSIDGQCFQDCTKLTITELPANLKTINNQVFYGCSNLALTKLPAGLTLIGQSSFRNCTKLTITELPANLKTIDTRAFSSCTGLTTITFKARPTTLLASSAFEDCINLKVINVPWEEGAVAAAPWGATNATINYNYTGA